jgi:thiol-disulfide isomerase/thioredoxin
MSTSSTATNTTMQPRGRSALRPLVQRSARAVALAVSLVAAPLAGQALAGGDWNDSGIAWKGYEDGLALAKREGKPVCLIFYTDWCPHCSRYSGVFHDPKVVEMSKKFVMIRLNKDANNELSTKYAPDGQYIPRTFFLSSAGEMQPDVHAPRPTYQYFYDEADPAGVLKGMDDALAKLAPKN